MITLQHTLVTLMGLRGDEEEIKKEIQYVLLPDAIRRYCGPRQYSHFERAVNGKENSWMTYPSNLKQLTKEEVDNLPKYIVKDIKPCVLGETSDINVFEQHNSHLTPEYYAGIKKHLTQDIIFDEFIREKIDCSRMYEDKFFFNGKEYDGKGIRSVIADIENHGTYILAYMLNKSYGITANQEWFDKNVKTSLDREFPEDLSNGTYQYMRIPEEINKRITEGDWSHLNEGLIPYKEYLEMYEKVIKEMPKIDYDKEVEKELLKQGKSLNRIGAKVLPEEHE